MVPFEKRVTVHNPSGLQAFFGDDTKNISETNINESKKLSQNIPSQIEIESQLEHKGTLISNESVSKNCENPVYITHSSHKADANAKNEDLQSELIAKTRQIQILQEQLESIEQLYSDKNLLQLEQMNRLVAVILEEKNQSVARLEIRIREQSDRLNILSKKSEAKDLIIQKLKVENKRLKPKKSSKDDSSCDSNEAIDSTPKYVENRTTKDKCKEGNKCLKVKYISKDDSSYSSNKTIQSKLKYVRMLSSKSSFENEKKNIKKDQGDYQPARYDDSSIDSTEMMNSESKYVGYRASKESRDNSKTNTLEEQSHCRHVQRSTSVWYDQKDNANNAYGVPSSYWYPTNKMAYYNGFDTPNVQMKK